MENSCRQSSVIFEHLEQIRPNLGTKDTTIYQLTDDSLARQVLQGSGQKHVHGPTHMSCELLQASSGCSNVAPPGPPGPQQGCCQLLGPHTHPHQWPLHLCSWADNCSFLASPSRSQSLRPQQRRPGSARDLMVRPGLNFID